MQFLKGKHARKYVFRNCSTFDIDGGSDAGSENTQPSWKWRLVISYDGTQYSGTVVCCWFLHRFYLIPSIGCIDIIALSVCECEPRILRQVQILVRAILRIRISVSVVPGRKRKILNSHDLLLVKCRMASSKEPCHRTAEGGGRFVEMYAIFT